MPPHPFSSSGACGNGTKGDLKIWNVSGRMRGSISVRRFHTPTVASPVGAAAAALLCLSRVVSIEEVERWVCQETKHITQSLSPPPVFTWCRRWNLWVAPSVGSPSSSHIVLFNAINRKFFQEGISRLRFNFFGRLRISVQTSREEAEVSESSLPALWWWSHVSLKLELWVENKNVCVSLTRLFNPSRAPQMNLMGHKMCQALFFALHWCIAPTVFVCTPPWN